MDLCSYSVDGSSKSEGISPDVNLNGRMRATVVNNLEAGIVNKVLVLLSLHFTLWMVMTLKSPNN